MPNTKAKQFARMASKAIRKTVAFTNPGLARVIKSQRQMNRFASTRPEKPRTSSTVASELGPVGNVRSTVVLRGNPGAAALRSTVSASEIVGTVTWAPASTGSSKPRTLSTPGAYECVPINPLYWPTTRVASTMRSYGKWRVKSAVLEFIPTLGTNWTGMVHMAGVPTQTNISAGLDPESMSACLSTLPTYRSYPIQSVGLASSKRSLAVTGLDWNTVRSPDAFCAFIMLTVTDLSGPETTPTVVTSVGKLMLHYEVELAEPVPPWNLVSGVTTVGPAINAAGYNFMTDSLALPNNTVYSSLQPDHWRVCRSWGTSGGITAAPVDGSSWGWYYPNNDPGSYTSATTGGFNPYLGQHLACVAQGSTYQTMQTSPEVKATIGYVKVSDVETGLDLTTSLESPYYSYKCSSPGFYALATVYYACVLPSTKAMPGDIDRGTTSATMSVSTSFVPTVETDATAPPLPDPDPQPSVALTPLARGTVFLPPIRK